MSFASLQAFWQLAGQQHRHDQRLLVGNLAQLAQRGTVDVFACCSVRIAGKPAPTEIAQCRYLRSTCGSRLAGDRASTGY